MSQDKKASTNKKQTNYVQVSRQFMASHRALIIKSPTAGMILSFMVEKMNKQNAIMISNKAMQEIFDKSKATIIRATNLLKNDNWLQIVKIGTSNAYFINTVAYWGDSLNKKQYAQFSAHVITSATEQTEDVKMMLEQKLKHIPTIGGGDHVIHDNKPLPPPDQLDFNF